MGKLHEIFLYLIPWKFNKKSEGHQLNNAVQTSAFCSTLEIKLQAVIKLDHFDQKHIMDIEEELDYSRVSF